MLKLIKVFNHCPQLTKLRTFSSKTSTTSLDKQYFGSDDEIMENVFGSHITIGINLRESKNVLTETALEKLNNSIKNFDSNDDLHAAVLHGCGGNFCTGTVGSDAAVELREDLLKTLHTLRKPIIAAMEGYITDFGLQLAMMCDIRIMDRSALSGFITKTSVPQSLKTPLFLYERLVSTIGIASTTELLCVRQMLPSAECLTIGLVNKVVDSGSALGQAMLTAQSIAFNSPLEKIIEHKSKILSVTKKV